MNVMKKGVNKKLDKNKKVRDLKGNLLVVNNASKLVNGSTGPQSEDHHGGFYSEK